MNLDNRFIEDAMHIWTPRNIVKNAYIILQQSEYTLGLTKPLEIRPVFIKTSLVPSGPDFQQDRTYIL
jgi:hypothetical protein